MNTELNAPFFITSFIIYMILMVFVGWFCSRGKSSGKNYLTGGGSMPLFLIFATMGATLIGTGSSIGATANGFRNGWGGSVYGLGAAIGLMVLALAAKKTKAREKGFLTMAEEAQFLYDGNTNLKAVMCIMMFIIEIVWLGNHINGGATYLSYVTGMDPVLSRFITVLAFGGYVLIGGYLAVVWTDFIQLIILVIGFVVITFVAVPIAGGFSEIARTLESAGKGGNLSFYGYKTMQIMPILSLLFAIGVPCLGTPTYRMRIYTAKDDKTAQKAIKRSAILLLCFSLLPAIIGMSAFTIATHNGASEILAKPDFAFSYLAVIVLGPVLGLLFMVAGLSATMSSGDSDAIAGVTILIQDIIPMFTKKAVPEEKVGALSRVCVLLTLSLAFFATLFAKDVMGYINNVIGSIIPGVSVAMFLGAFWKRRTWQGGMASVISGTAFGVLFLTIPSFKQIIASTFAGPAIPATLISLCFAIIFSLSTKKIEMTDEEKLKLVYNSRG